jgi:hypothetical protein
MKKTIVVSLGILIAVCAIVSGAPDQSKMVLKPGDEVYACACGDSCTCQMMSRNAGKCACGMAMVKAKVKSVGEGTAVLMFGQREQTFKTTGKYMCGCPGCTCNTISQTPAKCTCGVDMVKVK